MCVCLVYVHVHDMANNAWVGCLVGGNVIERIIKAMIRNLQLSLRVCDFFCRDVGV